MVALGDVLEQDTNYIHELEPRLYPKLSVKLYGRGVVLDQPAHGADVRMNKHQLAQSGQVILSEIWAKKGAIGIVPTDGEGALCTSHFFLFNIKSDKVHPKYIEWLLCGNYFEPQLGTEARGTTGYAAVRPKQFLAATIPLPPLSEQHAIVAKLDELSDKTRQLNTHLDAIEADADRLLSLRFRDAITNAPYRLMSEVAPLVRREQSIAFDGSYPELGVRSFGKGTFHKPPLSGAEVGTKRLYRIEPGDLIFSNVFAWEGAITIAQPEDTGRYGSHRFMTCVVNNQRLETSFLLYYLLSPEGMEKIREASPGGAGRNRTLGVEKLAKIEVPVPSLEVQRDFVTLQATVATLKAKHSAIHEANAALLPAILGRIFS
jgi:type I restriction enzyme S subunit